jgi:hypothetical protein
MPSAFFEPTDDPERFTATGHCAGPWDPTMQHAGPPSALLVRSIERHPTSIDGQVQITRLSIDILRPVPVGDVTVKVAPKRPDRAAADPYRRGALDLPVARCGTPATRTRWIGGS